MIFRRVVLLVMTVLFFYLFVPPLLFAQNVTQATADTTKAEAVYDSLFLREQTPEPAFNVVAKDNENDGGKAIAVRWAKSPDDFEGGVVKEYRILRSTSPDGPYEEVGSTPQGVEAFVDFKVIDGVQYFYKIVTMNHHKINGETVWQTQRESAPAGPVISSAQWFNLSRLNIFFGIVILCGSISYFIYAARSGKKFYIRKIAGIEEVENAVGRATEMGRAIYYIPGIQDMDDVQTIASMTILGRVAIIAAGNDTRIDVPVSRSMVMITAREMVKEAYSKVGRPDSFREDQVRYLTDDQFGYAAAIDGLFVREKPATIFMIGTFFAESLIMAETGNSIGAIQIAGTAQPAQLPFFVAACDYTLIGEEMFAASAYLSGEPKLLGSLKGQDVGKAIAMIAIVVGVVLSSLGIYDLSAWFNAN